MNERLDTYENLTNMEVVRRYRLDKDGIDRLNDEYGDRLAPRTLGQRNVSALEKIIVTLRYFASGDFQINDGDIHKLSQPSVSRAVTQFTEMLANQETMTRNITFPTSMHDITRVKTDFQGIANFANVVGVVDGTQVQIQAPHVNEDAYVNRMGYHSINTQVIFNGQDRLIDIVARWPGSTHDSRILRESSVYQLFERGHVASEHKYLLGDSGYPCKQWLLTPYLNPANAGQVNYNRVIMACGVLHNICKEMNIPMIGDDIPANMQQEVPYQGIQNGLRYRDFVALTYFN
ncbi:putative nuclease HARBI1 [Dreissena polymorpha]|uniref:putative nuclease HARBI1 n=1 Tax=Dreissena polymorpha TaxID=45954 RepID=UPI00226490D3|nr:putative nuclease HARBI1 [Dreissena polymorpha]XP_052242388.1 putative nuclease HARBI1 [Dreissena polymorpha]